MDMVLTNPDWSLLASALTTYGDPTILAFLLAPGTHGYTLWGPSNTAFEATALKLGLPHGMALLSDPRLSAVLAGQMSTYGALPG